MNTSSYTGSKSSFLTGMYNKFKKTIKYKLQSENFDPLTKLEKSEYRSQFDLLEKSSLLLIADINGKIIYVNDKFCEISKYTYDELIGNSQSIVSHTDSSEKLKKVWQTILSGQIWQGELLNKAKDGSLYWVEATVFPILDKFGKPKKYLSSSREISQEKKMKLQIQDMQNRGTTHLFESVNYAKHVHGTFLTPEKVLRDTFQESFLIYQAQNIVSGDFHMIQKKGNISTFILGDSTGHGVSASYISIMILNILNRILRSPNYTTRAVLQELHDEITLIRNSNPTETFIESADMAFCKIDYKSMSIEYNLAKLRGVLIRNGEIIDLKRDKYSIGEQWTKELDLSDNVFHLKYGDLIYLYTDGFIDQFGGPQNKKFGTKRLIESLKECVSLNMEEQKFYLTRILKEWQGNLEQTDDISLIGVRI